MGSSGAGGGECRRGLAGALEGVELADTGSRRGWPELWREWSCPVAGLVGQG
jgi:hypothetical protein